MDRDAECFLFGIFSTDDDNDYGGDDDDDSCGYDDDGDGGDDEDEDEDDDDDDGSQVFFFPEAHGCHASSIRALDEGKKLMFNNAANSRHPLLRREPTSTKEVHFCR